MGQLPILCIQQKDIKTFCSLVNLNQINLKLPENLEIKKVIALRQIPRTSNGKIKRQSITRLIKDGNYVGI